MTDLLTTKEQNFHTQDEIIWHDKARKCGETPLDIDSPGSAVRNPDLLRLYRVF